MTKIKVLYFILGGVILGPILFFLLASIRNSDVRTSLDYISVENAAKEIHCPDGAKLEYGRWGKSGWMAKCQLAHGPFVAAENGHVAIKGEYALGKPVGETKVFDASGKQIRSERP